MANASGMSGAQIVLRHRDQVATVVEVGGGIRDYRRGGRPILDGYGPEEICPAAHGQPLIPWPNRIGGGRYRFGGREHQLALTEPARGNAIHGLLRWVGWQVAEREPTRAVLHGRVHPQPGYPFALGVEIEYGLGDDGLRVTMRAVNLGGVPLPFGAGQHPYLWAGESRIDGARLRLAAEVVLEMNERSIPVGRRRVDSELDFATPRELGEARLDHCYTGLGRDAAGRCTVDLAGRDGQVTRLWMDASWSWVQVFTGDGLGEPLARRGLAVEPMTCPPNAFQTGEGLIVLAPGERFEGSWGVGPAT
jgi:aldose 1-epimerase